MEKARKKKRSWQEILLVDVRNLKGEAEKLSDANAEEAVKSIFRYDPDKRQNVCLEVDKLKPYSSGFSLIAAECGKLIDCLDSELFEDAGEPIGWYSNLTSRYAYLRGHLDCSTKTQVNPGAESRKRKMEENLKAIGDLITQYKSAPNAYRKKEIRSEISERTGTNTDRTVYAYLKRFTEKTGISEKTS